MNLRRRLKSLELKLSHQDISNRPSSIWLIGVEPGGVCQCAGGWVWDGDQYRQASQEERLLISMLPERAGRAC